MNPAVKHHRRLTRSAILYRLHRAGQPMTQAELAEWVGVPVFSIARMLHDLRLTNAIRAEDRIVPRAGWGRRRVLTYSVVPAPAFHFPAWLMPPPPTGTPAAVR